MHLTLSNLLSSCKDPLAGSDCNYGGREALQWRNGNGFESVHFVASAHCSLHSVVSSIQNPKPKPFSSTSYSSTFPTNSKCVVILFVHLALAMPCHVSISNVHCSFGTFLCVAGTRFPLSAVLWYISSSLLSYNGLRV